MNSSHSREMKMIRNECEDKIRSTLERQESEKSLLKQ